jgi:hypothetical protein
MSKYLFPVAVIIILLVILISIYNTKKYRLPKQLSAALIGALLLLYLLYTCKSDD